MNKAQIHDHLDELLPSDEIPDNTTELVPVKSPLKKWAAENAYLLVYLTIMFAIGWAVTVATH